MQPTAGPSFHLATRADVRGPWRKQERRLLLLAIAGFIDAEHAPNVWELSEVLGVTGYANQRARVIDGLLAALERDGLISVERAPAQRNVYTLTLNGAVRTRGSGRRAR